MQLCYKVECMIRELFCRSHWLLAMQQEWEAAQCAESQLIQLGKVRDRRCRLEALHDAACSSLVAEHAKQWGAVPTNA